MGLSCVQCGNKVGLFKKPVEGLYCSVACRDTADEEARAQLEARRLAVDQAAASDGAPAPASSPPPAAPSVAPPASSVPPGQAMPSAPAANGAQASSAPSASSSGVAPASVPRVPCPKCTQQWHVEPGAGAFGKHRGSCRWCGFGAEFIALRTCPNCRGASLVVHDPHDARCPRCKVRVQEWDEVG